MVLTVNKVLEQMRHELGGGDLSTELDKFAVLNGRDPKNPRSADIGLGWALAMIGTSGRAGSSDCASLPHRIATRGASSRSTRPRMAASVMRSQPIPR